MAILNIVEYDHIRESEGSLAQLPQEPYLDSNNLTFTTAAQSGAFNAATRIVRIWPEVDCYIKFGDNPTAALGDLRMSAGVPEYFAIPDGVNVRTGSETLPFKVSAVAA